MRDRSAADALLLVNSRLWSPGSGYLPGDSLLIRDERIFRYGRYRDFTDKSYPVVDLQGALVIPGFNDAHMHLMEGGLALQQVQLRDSVDENEFCERLRKTAAALAPGSWITGGYWDHENWPSRRLPTRGLLDRAVPDHPVFVLRLDCHIGVANSLALQLAGIDESIANPPGGEFERDPQSGELTGILKDEAHKAMLRAIPALTEEMRYRALRHALHHAAALGVTSGQGQCEAADLPLFRRMAEQNQLTMRLSLWSIPEQSDSFTDLDGDWLRWGGVKLFADGSLGAATALLSSPYVDPSDSCGLEIYSAEEFRKLILTLDRRECDLVVHAIGDAAVTRTLDAFGNCQQVRRRRSRRHRIEHAQVVQPNDVPRFGQLGVIASLQPSHAIDDMRWIADRLGERQQWSYRLASLLHAGTSIALGTDWNVEPLDPLLTLHAAVWRQDTNGRPTQGWFPAERVSIDQAVNFYTSGSAFAERQENQKGRLQLGYLADLVALSHDIFADPRTLLEARVEMTMVGGKIVYQHNVQAQIEETEEIQ